MCGRFTITSEKELIIKRFKADLDGTYKPRYNAAPSDELPIILNAEPKKIKLVKWGIRPEWIKKLNKADGLINIRAETLRDKPTFKADFEKRRCLVIADGFYEWQKVGTKKIPYRAVLKDGGLFAFAGLWEENKDEQGKPFKTFAIITTEPNNLMKPIHNRMPVMLDQKAESIWLDEKVKKEELLKTLAPYAAGKMRTYQVSPLVNNPSFDQSDLIQEAAK